VAVVEGRHATVAEAGLGTDDAGTGADQSRIPAEPVRRRVEGAGGRERLVLAAVDRRRGDVAAKQTALAQLDNIAAERARQRAAAGLHIADLPVRRRLSGGPGRRRQMPVQRQNQHRHRPLKSFRC
jgi:hypothetical protein